VQREDDKAETVVRRLAEYDEKTKPLIGYYRSAGTLVEIDGLQPVEAVTHQLLHVLGVEHAH
jgi:adenylate kinase